MGTCGPIIKYEASLKLGGTAPSFLNVDSTLKSVEIFTNDLSFYGSHDLKISGAPQLYSANSILDSLFTVTI